LLTGELGVGDLKLDSTQEKISTNKDGFLSFVYSNAQKAPFNGGFILSLLIIQPLVESDESFTVPAAQNGTFSSGGTITDLSDTVVFKFSSNEIISKLEFKSGDFTISGSSTFLNGVKATFTIPDLKDGNQMPYTGSLTLGGSASKDTSIDIKNYSIDLTTVGATNNLPVIVTVKSTSPGQVPRAGDKIDLKYKFSNFTMSYAKGDISFPPFTIAEDSTVIDALSKITTADIKAENPIITVVTKNSFGMQIPVKFTKFVAELNDGSTMPVIKSPYPDSAVVKSATVRGELKVDTTFKFDDVHSNINAILAAKPKKLIYGFESKTYGVKPIGFVQDTSHLYVNTRLEVPLSISIKNVAFVQSFSSDLSGIPTTESAAIQINTENDFPISIKLQVYFLDKDSVKLDSLNSTNQDIIGPGTRINNVQTASKKTVTMLLNATQLSKIKATGKIIKIKAMAQTPAIPTFSKFYADQKIRINMGILVKHIDASSLGKK
jgi:hypothetical protein